MGHEQHTLAHYGIRGQKWGQRRFQNEDGSYTPEGKERYNRAGDAADRKRQKQENKERYRRGKELSKERDSVVNEKRKKILDNDVEFQYHQERSKQAERDYENARNEWEKESAAYNQGRHDAASDERWGIASEKALKSANRVMTKKYGDKAVSDIEYYKAESSKKFNRFVGGTLLALSLAAIGISVATPKNRQATKDAFKDAIKRSSDEYARRNRT